jgi:hypothetical protein
VVCYLCLICDDTVTVADTNNSTRYELIIDVEIGRKSSDLLTKSTRKTFDPTLGSSHR